MTDLEAARTRLAQHRPQLVSSFDRLLGDVAPVLGMSTETIESSLHLTLAGEFLYIDGGVLSRVLERDEYHVFSRVLHRLAKAGHGVGGEFIRLYGGIPFRIAEVGEALGALVEAAEGAEIRMPLRLSLSREDAREAATALRFFAVILGHAPGIAKEVCRVAETYLRRRPWSRLSAWLQRGVDLMESGRVEAGVDHLRLMSHESRQILGFRYVALGDVRGVLSIYASSLCGHRLTVNECGSSPFVLDTPHTDGAVIYLPARLQCSPVSEENRRAYTALAALQAAAISFGTFRFDMTSLAVLDHVRDRYGTVLADEMEHLRKFFADRAKTVRERTSGDVEAVLEDDRTLLLLETYHEEFFFRFPTPDLARELFQLLETARLERKLVDRYPGLAGDFAVVDTWLARRQGHFVVHSESYEELAAVLETLGRRIGTPSAPAAGADRAERDRAHRSSERIEEMMRAVRGVYAADSTVYETAEATFSLYNLLYDVYELVPFCRQHDVRRLFASRDKFSLHPEAVRDQSPHLMAPREKREEVITEHAQGEQDIDLASLGAADRESRRIRRALIGAAYSIHRYPEFDHTIGGYRPDHCTVYESALQAGDPGYYTRTLAFFSLVHKRVKKRFLALQPEEVSISRKWEDGEDIHIGDATDYATSLLMGRTVDEKVYMRKITNRRDVTVSILLDASSSTAEPIAGGTIIDLEKAALAILSSALATIGDRFAVYTYFSMGRSNVFVNIVKDFAESWNREAQGRIAAIEAHASNRDGAAIRHVTRKLAAEPGRTKLLILLSDGIPADPGYGGSSAAETSRYALEDTRRALTEAKREGVTPFCVTIDRFARSYIPHLYGAYHYTVLDDISLLPERLSRVYLRLTR